MQQSSISDREVARDISYASSAKSRSGQALIRLVENATGRVRLIKRAKGYEHDVAQGHDFWKVMARRYGITLDVMRGSLENIPQTGPLILLANHPFGILDGLMMGYILSTVRGDFRILANRVFKKAEDINRIILPVSFDETKEAVKLNLETRKAALNYLSQGGAIGVFPGGTVSTGVNWRAHPMDPGWRNFTAKMIAKSNATVVPMYFDGTTSRLFQVASHMHSTLRMALLIREFHKRTDRPVQVVIGDPVPQSELQARAKDPSGMMQYLRAQTYALSPHGIDPYAKGHEFETKYR